MRSAWLIIFAVGLSGCLSDFTGDEGKVEFVSTLSRQSVRWTPQQAIAVGEHFAITPWDPPCVLGCAGSRFSLDGGFVDDGGVLELEDGGALVARAEGTGVLRFTGRDADQVTFRVKAVDQVRLSDPLVLNARDWPRILIADAGLPPVFPDVGNEVVIGEDAGLFLEVVPLDDAGQLMGISRGRLAILGGGPGVSAAAGSDDDRLLDLHTGSAGAHAQVTVSLADGGRPSQYEVRVASASEVRSLTLFSAVESTGAAVIIRAVAQRDDGGVFFEPPLDWVLPPDVTQFPYAETSALTLRRRRDVIVLNNRVPDGGTRQVRARVGGVEATLDVTLDPFEDSDGGVAAGPPPMGCGCSGGPGVGLLPFLLLLGWRRRA